MLERLHYFSHDIDMRNDLKIRGLRGRFGNDGYAVWCYLLEVLTDSRELCINISEMSDLLSADFDVEAERLHSIIGYCVKVGLLQRDGDTIYSMRHQERIVGVMEKAREKSERGRKAVLTRWNKSSDDTEVIPSHTDVLQMNTNKKEEDKRKEKETKEKKNKKERSIDYPCSEVVDLWNTICPSLPKVIRLSDTRREKVKARLKEWGDGDREKMIEYTKQLFSRIEASDFLTGRSGKWKGATFDWIFDNRNNWIKVMEGNYDNQRGGGSAAPSATKKLGVGEYTDANGNRTYGSGKAIIPQDAPPRPSERHSWNASNNQWILQ